MSATAAKVALVASTTALSGQCPPAGVVDFIGYAANCAEGSPTGTPSAPGLSNATADFRAGAGCTDNDNNATDFSASAPVPRNSASAVKACLLISNLALPEGDAGSTAFAFSAKLNIAAPSDVTFNATTQDGTASAASDYTALLSAPFTIAAGQNAATVTVQVSGDTLVEPDETFTLQITNIAGASPRTSPTVVTGTIQNDDIAAVNLSFSPSTLPGGTEGVAYSQVLTVNNGTNCSFSSSGSVPPGLSLSFTGAKCELR
jgi:hypothetical protein